MADPGPDLKGFLRHGNLPFRSPFVAAPGTGPTIGMVDLQRHNVAEDARVVVRQSVSSTAERASRSLGTRTARWAP